MPVERLAFLFAGDWVFLPFSLTKTHSFLFGKVKTLDTKKVLVKQKVI